MLTTEELIALAEYRKLKATQREILLHYVRSLFRLAVISKRSHRLKRLGEHTPTEVGD